MWIKIIAQLALSMYDLSKFIFYKKTIQIQMILVFILYKKINTNPNDFSLFYVRKVIHFGLFYIGKTM